MFSRISPVSLGFHEYSVCRFSHFPITKPDRNETRTKYGQQMDER